MLLIKMIRIAGLLKELELSKYFSDGKCDVQNMVKNLPEKVIFDLCEIITENKAVNIIDAIAGIADFFLSLIEQVKTSPNCLNLIDRLPIPADGKKAILNLLGKT